MLKMTDLDDYHLIPIQKGWFKGRIYVDKRARTFPFQTAILEKYISEISAKSYKGMKIKLDFHILVTGDTENVEFSIDVFAFIDNMIVYDDQNVFNNAFSGIHWGLSSIFSAISKICDDLLELISAGNNTEIKNNPAENNVGDVDDLLPGEFIVRYEKNQTIN